ncbi:hypothetical protein SAMN05216420_104103 [Nitrosospira sp. Nl5]|uniref:hypothetical protein n=1 Tax=Nitrosospira sp. Nl5 TaxID=200120 RepID=UPI000885310B|nr:hypothetical protein [Nitrosospira sp. Nl5]SCY28403.1 hypothetical protein SAMN05216420_104103 [Nitrosospira sp. Nl5]
MAPFSDLISHVQRPDEVLYKGDTITAIPLAIIAHVDAGGRWHNSVKFRIVQSDRTLIVLSLVIQTLDDTA